MYKSRTAHGAAFLALLLFTSTALADVSILVRQEFGFSFVGGNSAIVQHNGPAVDFNDGLFEVFYSADTFSVRVTEDFGGGSPFGFSAYRSFYTPEPANDPNRLAFIPIVGNISAGTVFSEPIVPIPEPSTLIFFAIAALLGVVRFNGRLR
jgi:hypothetical protein